MFADPATCAGGSTRYMIIKVTWNILRSLHIKPVIFRQFYLSIHDMREDDAPCRVAQPTAGCSYHFLFQISITQEFRASSTPISPRLERQHHPPTSYFR